MSTVPNPVRSYPLPSTAPDPRFTSGLIHDVAAVLQDAGYPALTRRDLTALSTALWRMLYQPTPSDCSGLDYEREPDAIQPPPPGVDGYAPTGREVRHG